VYVIAGFLPKASLTVLVHAVYRLRRINQPANIISRTAYRICNTLWA